MLISSYINLAQSRVILGDGTSVEKILLTRLACWQAYSTFSFTRREGQPTEDGATLRLVSPKYIKNQAEKSMGTKSVSSTPSGPPLHFLLPASLP